ncbi:MAG TPA: VOC family protein [Burkholderiales bacterium]|jgi:PhnB protein|nr:VOC family protein [Burkholderiales bacterium]
MHTQIYLFFDGRTEEALAFYKKTLGIEVEMLMRFKDAPGPDDPNCPPPPKPDAVMHSSFKLGGQNIMASDGNCGGKAEFKGFSLSLAVKTEGEAEKLFAALSEGGQVTQPLIQTFFSPKFGMVQDKFGVGWMVLVEQPS